MATQKIDQETQVGQSDLYDDQLSTGASLQSSAANLRDDLNAIRTQLRQIIHGEVIGHWYDDPATAYGADISLQALFFNEASGFDEDDILVLRNSDIAVSSTGYVLRRK